jgi:hypothetical protein
MKEERISTKQVFNMKVEGKCPRRRIKMGKTG